MLNLYFITKYLRPMKDKVTPKQVEQLATDYGYDPAYIKAFIEVESAGKGFSKDGKILIQFEPHLFKRFHKNWKPSAWSDNKVSVQSEEWKSFNSAYAQNPDAAMMATSIGMGQILGQHYERLGYDNVGAMWEDFKRGEYQQVDGILRFIKADKRLHTAVLEKDHHLVATYYNGEGYKALALKLGTVPYDRKLKEAYERYR